MNKITTLFLLTCLSFSAINYSCNKTASTGGGNMYDPTLSGMVSLITGYYITEYEGYYGDVGIKDLRVSTSRFSVNKYSDNLVAFNVFFIWNETSYHIFTGYVVLEGERSSVTFDSTGTGGTVLIGDKEYSQINYSVSGWIREVESASVTTREPASPPSPVVECNIEMNFMVADEELVLKITSIERHP